MCLEPIFVVKMYLQRLEKIIQENSGFEFLVCQLVRGFRKSPQLKEIRKRDCSGGIITTEKPVWS